MDRSQIAGIVRIFSHKKNVSVVGVRFVKTINRQIQVFKKVFQKKKRRLKDHNFKVNVKLKRPQKDNNFECMPSLCKYDLYDNLLLFRK